MASGPTHLVPQKGSHIKDNIEKKSLENKAQPSGITTLKKKNLNNILVNKKFLNKGPADTFSPGPHDPKAPLILCVVCHR